MTSDKPKKETVKGKKVSKQPVKAADPVKPVVDTGIKPGEKAKPVMT